MRTSTRSSAPTAAPSRGWETVTTSPAPGVREDLLLGRQTAELARVEEQRLAASAVQVLDAPEVERVIARLVRCVQAAADLRDRPADEGHAAGPVEQVTWVSQRAAG